MVRRRVTGWTVVGGIISFFLCMWPIVGHHKDVIRIHRPVSWKHSVCPHDKGVVIFWNLQVGHLWPPGGPEGVRTNPGGSDVDAA